MTPAEFKTIRESLGLSAQWLADAVHVDQRTVRRWEDGAIPLRADIVELLTRLDEQMDTDVATALEDWLTEHSTVLAIATATGRSQAATNLDTSIRADLDELLDALPPEDWPVVEVPRVDADVTGDHTKASPANSVPGLDRPLPAAFHRATAIRLRALVGGRLRITYTTCPEMKEAHFS